MTDSRATFACIQPPDVRDGWSKADFGVSGRQRLFSPPARTQIKCYGICSAKARLGGPLSADCVEKVETWMRAILRSACLKAALSRSNAVQTPYEGHSLRGGSMMRSPASLLEQLTSTSAKTRRSVTTDFFNTICHEQTSRRSLDYLVGQQ
jgi:hypothetical protein